MKWLRKRLAWISAVAVAGMVFWLAFSAVTLQHAQGGVAGTLFKQPVQVQEYARSLEAVTHDALLRFGDRYRQQVPDAQLQQQAWERLILLIEARKIGIRVSDREVIEEIQKIPVFQARNGRFDQAGYENLLRYSLGTTPRAYEEEIRDDLAIRKLFDQAIGTPTVTEPEILEGFHRKEERIRVSFLALPQYALAQEIADAARQDPEQMKKAARQLKLEIKTTAFFKRSDPVPEINAPDNAFSAAFDLKPDEISRPLPGPKGWLIAQLKERQPADESKLGSVRGDLEKELTNQKKLRAYFTWYQDLLKRADLKSR